MTGIASGKNEKTVSLTGDVRLKYHIPNDAKEMKVDSDFSEDMTLSDIVGQIAERGGTEGYAYVMWRGIPVLVGRDISPDEAMESFYTNMTQKDRELLGDRWTSAVASFKSLLSILEELPPDQRSVLGKKYFKSWVPETHISSEARGFFEKPSFEAVEEIMKSMPTRNDADALERVVKGITDIISPKKDQSPSL
jgi:hypothetical protein